MAELVVDGRTTALVEVASTRRARARGLLGRDRLDGALWLPGTRSVHTFGMRFPIDVAACDRTGAVLAVATLGPGRVLWPRRRVRAVVEAPAGALATWGVAIGSRLEVRPG